MEEEKNPKRYKILLAAVVLIAGFFAATFAASSSLTSNASAQIAPAGNDKMAGEGRGEDSDGFRLGVCQGAARQGPACFCSRHQRKDC
ncbi:MAG TPA: hypothetical protein VF016_05340 [Nitrososphaera sp.]